MVAHGDVTAQATPNPEEFARELTDLCRKHGLAFAGTPTLFVMEYDDHALEYVVDDKGRLVLS